MVFLNDYIYSTIADSWCSGIWISSYSFRKNRWNKTIIYPYRANSNNFFAFMGKVWLICFHANKGSCSYDLKTKKKKEVAESKSVSRCENGANYIKSAPSYKYQATIDATSVDLQHLLLKQLITKI